MTTRYYNPNEKILNKQGVDRVFRILIKYDDMELANSNGAGETVFHVGREKTTLGIYDLTNPSASIRGSIQIIGEDNHIHLTQRRLEKILGTRLVEVRM